MITKGSVLLASGAGHLSAIPNLEGFTWKKLMGLLLEEGPTGWGLGEVLLASERQLHTDAGCSSTPLSLESGCSSVGRRKAALSSFAMSHFLFFFF